MLKISKILSTYLAIFLLLTLLNACSALNKAANTNDIQLLQKTISEGKEDVNNNPLPLIISAQKGHSQITEILLDAGANPDLTDAMNQSPLLWAASKNHPEIIKILLDAKANTEIKEKKFGQTALMVATIKNHTECAGLLLKGGASPNVYSNNGVTPLLDAVATQHFTIVKELLENGSDPNLTNKIGVSPLLYAVGKKNLRLVKILIKNGAHIDVQEDAGITPLTLASTNGNIAIVKELISSGADINKIENKFGTTPLLQAGIKKHYAIADYLIKQGADKDIPAYNGLTLHQQAINTNDNRLLEISKFNIKTIMLTKVESELNEELENYHEQKKEYDNNKSKVEQKEMIFLEKLSDSQLELYSKYTEYIDSSKNKAKTLLSFRKFSKSLDTEKENEYVSLYSDMQKMKSDSTLLKKMNLNLDNRKQIIAGFKKDISEEKTKYSEEDRQRIAALRNRQQAVVAQKTPNTNNWIELLTIGLSSYNKAQAKAYEAQKVAYKQYEIDRKHRELVNSINDIERTIKYDF